MGVQSRLRLPPALAVDPANLSAAEQQAGGIKRLPCDLGEAIAAFEADTSECARAGSARRQHGWGEEGCRAPLGDKWAFSERAPVPAPVATPRRCTAVFRATLDMYLGSGALSRAFLAVRRSEWSHFRGMPLEAEAAALYGRY